MSRLLAALLSRLDLSRRAGRRPRRRAGHRRLALEPLEDRTLPSVVIAPTNNNGQGYAALDFNHSGGYVPPDTCGAAGPSAYVETVNQTVALYGNKATGSPAALSALSTFWFTTGGLPRTDSGSGLSDPIVTYNDQIGRFIVGDQDVDFNTHVSNFDVAVSKTSNPSTLGTADWNFYHVNTTESGFDADYPGNFGYNHDAFVFTLNMFPTVSGFHVQIVSVSNADLANGVSQSSLHVFHNDISTSTLRPTTMHDSVAGDPMWLVTEGGGNTIDVVKMTNVLSNTATFAHNSLSVTPYSSVVNPLNPNGTVITNNIDSRIQKAAEWNGLLVATHSVSVSSTQDVAQWYLVNVSSGTPTFQDQGRVSAGPNTYVFYPGIDINAAGQIGMTYMKSGTDSGTDFMSMYVTGRATGDAAGTMETPVLVPAGAGQANYHDFTSGGRAGDLSGINVDPSDGTFWGANEFANTEATANWGTAVANFTFGTTLTVNGTSGNDTITVQNQPGNPADTQVIVNGSSVFTGPWNSLSGITIAASTGNDIVNIENDAAGVPITVNLGNGTDTVNLSPVANNLGNLLASVAVNGGGGVDTLNVDDQATNTAQSWTLSANSVTRSGAGSVVFTQIGNLIVNGGNTGGATNTYTITGTQAAVTTTLNTGVGFDVTNLGKAGSVQGIAGAVTIASPATYKLTIDDSQDAGNRTTTIGTGGITGLAPAAINFTSSSVSTLTILGGSGTDSYTVAAIPGSGATLTAGTGTNTLIGPNVLTSWQLTGTGAGQFMGSGMFPLSFTGVTNLTGGSAADDFAFFPGGAVAGNIDGGGGSNSLDYQPLTTAVSVDLTAGTATAVGGSVANIQELIGGSGNNTLNGNSSGTTTFVASTGNDTITGAGGTNTLVGSGTWNVTAQNSGTLTSGTSTATFSGIQNFALGKGNSTFVFSDGAGIDGNIVGKSGKATNTLDLSAYTTAVTVDLSANTATGIGGTFSGLNNFIGSGAGGNTLQGPNAATTWTITSQNTGMLSGGISFNGFQNLTGGSANDTFVFANGVGVDGNLNGGGGGNTLNLSAYTTAVAVDLTANTATGVGGAIANLQSFVGGSSAGNSLNGPAAATTWALSGSNAGSLSGGLSFSAFGNLTSGGGGNTFAFAAGATLSGTLTGGGSDTLNYSAYATSVIVDLQIGFATGVAGGVAGIANVNGANSGGAGLYNLLIGSGGNVLTGGTGRRNILVAGGSASTLVGGGQDDLLIGGTTAYDTDPALAAWQQIAAYWAGGDSYATRVGNLEGGNGVPLLDATTVTGNGGGNTMTSGFGELALIYTDGLDTISGFNAGSQQYTISP